MPLSIFIMHVMSGFSILLDWLRLDFFSIFFKHTIYNVENLASKIIPGLTLSSSFKFISIYAERAVPRVLITYLIIKLNLQNYNYWYDNGKRAVTMYKKLSTRFITDLRNKLVITIMMIIYYTAV